MTGKKANEKQLYRELGRQLEIEREKMNKGCIKNDGSMDLGQTGNTQTVDTLVGKLRELEKEIFVEE